MLGEDIPEAFAWEKGFEHAEWVDFLNSLDEIIETLKADNYVPDQVWAKYTDTLQNLPDTSPAPKRKATHKMKYAAILAASIGVLTGTIVYAQIQVDYLN